MPEYDTTLRNIPPYQYINVAATSTKEMHKRYGNYAKRLSIIIKRVVNPPKGQWQAWWGIATRVFGFAYTGGHNEKVLTTLAQSLAEEYGVDGAKAVELAKYIKQNMSAIVGEAAREEATEGGILF
jgi:hypothetical protein